MTFVTVQEKANGLFCMLNEFKPKTGNMTINSLKELKTLLGGNERLFLLLYKSGAEQSDCSLKRVDAARQDSKFPLYTSDVNFVRDIHPEYGITSAPTLLEFRDGQLKNIYKGCQTEEFYTNILAGSGFEASSPGQGKPAKRVTVYTTPTCTWCTTIKTYLKEKNISFTEVNVAADPARAQEMVRKSGQQGVPQTDINGQIVVGFDKKRINELLEIR